MEKVVNNEFIKDRKLTKYICLGEKRKTVLRPKEIVRLVQGYEVYGDARFLGQMTVPKQQLDKWKEENKTMLYLRTKRTKKGFYIFHAIESSWFNDSRRHRLAASIAHMGLNKNNEDEISFMKSELQLESHVSYGALKEMFLKSEKESLKITDLKRLIQIWEDKARVV